MTPADLQAWWDRCEQDALCAQVREAAEMYLIVRRQPVMWQGGLKANEALDDALRAAMRAEKGE